MDVEIGIKNDWKYFNTPPQSQPSILSLTLGSIGCKAVPRMPTVAQGFSRVRMAMPGCAGSCQVMQGRTSPHWTCIRSQQVMPGLHLVTPVHACLLRVDNQFNVMMDNLTVSLTS